VLSVVATSLAGILSNPLFTIANNAVINSPILQAHLETKETVATIVPAIDLEP
jgi:NAD(P)H-quinone oxidoreductase subunit 2